ncbi:MAG TPA: hypothetical protein DCG18_06365 [Richelia sp.]|nr:hypothetical protein [Richelia sp.]
MKTMAKLYKEYRSIFEMSAFICLLALLLIGAGLISYVGSAKADTKISSDCVYYGEEILDNGKKICYYECDKESQDLVIDELSECPTNE